MSFRYELQPASFRGVPFVVSSADTAVGRRAVVHEFPLKEAPASEDLGRKASEFVVEGFIVGDDYLDGMRRLVGALTAPGPGTLVHPSFGTLQVVLAYPGRLREQFIERRGMVSFLLPFIEVSDADQPSFDDIDTQQLVEDQTDWAYLAIQSDFAGMFSINGAPGWSIQSITDEINQVSSVLSKVRSALRFDLSSLSQLVRAGVMFKANLSGLLATPNALSTELSVHFRALTNLFNFSAAQGISLHGSTAGAATASGSSAFGSTAPAPTGSGQTALQTTFGNATKITTLMLGLLSLATYGQPGSQYARPSIPANTPVRRQQAANQAALFALVARCAVLEAVRSSIYLPFASADEAVAVRDTLYDALDALMMDAADPVYAALHEVRGAMVRDITARGANLAQLSSLTLQASVPAQVLSYRLYGSGAYAAELIERNQLAATVAHPLFMAGGKALEVRRVS